MTNKKEDEVIFGLIPSVMRRGFGSGVLYALGALFIFIAVAQPPSGLHWIVVLIAAGAASMYGGYRMWQLSGRMILLSEEGLKMSDGVVIAELADVEKVDRSFFAFKPSNGFLVTLKRPYPTMWVPGLWWRVGRRVGIGGLTSPGEGKVMADTLAALLAERDGLVDLS